MVQETPPEMLLDDYANDLDVVEQNFARNIRATFLKWAIRWVIGFGLIWAVTAWTGRFGWLWTFGIVVALLSLSFQIWVSFMLRKRLREARDTQAKLNSALAEARDDDA